MIEVRETAEYRKWFSRLRDLQARARILARLRRITLGNLGDIQPVGDGVSELRIHHGPGYRIYIAQRGAVLVVLLLGGDKSSQADDIKAARTLARELED